MADNPYDKVYDNLFTQDTTSDMAQRDPIMPAPTPIPVPAIPDPANDITAPISLPETSLRSSFMDGMQYKPDEAAKALPLAKQNQLPLDMTLRNLPDLQKQADFNNIDFKTLNRDYPKLAEFFSQPDNAAVAHDSVDSLKWIQDKGSALWYSGWGGVANVIGYGADVLKHVSIPGTDNSDVRKMLESVQETTDQAAWYANYRESQLPDTFGNQLAGMVGQMAPATAATMLDPLAGGLMWAGMFARPMQIAAKEHGAGEDMQTLVGAASALTSTLAVTPALKALTGKSPIIQEMISKVPDFVKQGWLQNIARSPWMQRALQAGGGAVAGAEMNVTQTILNNLIEHYTFNPDKKIIENIGKQAEMGGTAGALMHMLLSRIGSKGMPSPEIPPMPPKDLAQNLKEQAKAIQENPLWKRSPEVFHELQKKIWGDKTLYIPAEEGIKFFQGQDEKTQNDIAQRIPDLAQRAAEAQATGADIPISYADYLAWIAPHDTNGTLASKAKMDAAHEPVDVASLYPELLKMIPKEEPHDEAAQALETKIVREAQQAGLAKHEAEAWAHMVRTAYGTIKGHSEEDAGPFAGLSVKPSNLVEGVSDKGLDFTIAQMKGRIRSRVAADKARADKTAEANAADIVGGKVAKKKEKAAPTPVMSYIAKIGGIKRGSNAAKELAHSGVTPETHPRLFSEKPGALTELDNIDWKNFNNEMVDRQLVAPSDDEHYIQHGWLHDAIVEESHGRGHLSPEDAARDEKNQYLDRFEGYIHSLGLEPDRATRAEIKAAVAKQRAGGETRYQFSGEKSLTSNLNSLAAAKKMLAEGKDVESIRNKTGWHKWVDGKWRYEISDKDARLKLERVPGAAGHWLAKDVKLEDILDHPKLFAAYPELRDIKTSLEIDPGVGPGSVYIPRMKQEDGSYSKPEFIIRNSTPEKALSSTLHEAQHAVQMFEGFAQGDNTQFHMNRFQEEHKGAWKKLGEINKNMDKLIGGNLLQDLKGQKKKQYDELMSQKMALVGDANRDYFNMQKRAYETYLRAAGEIEDRNTQKRANMTDEERKATPPSETQDKKDEEALVVFHDGMQFSAPETITGVKTETPEFKKWFGKSQVVGKDGKPLVMYHGTTWDFSTFDTDKIKSRFPQSFGFHFTDRPPEASIYADDGRIKNHLVGFDPSHPRAEDIAKGANVMPVFIRVENPLIIETSHATASMEADLNRAEIIHKIVDSRETGNPYDGVIIRKKNPEKWAEWDGVNVIVFDPKQIKSAIGNNGKFDPNDSNILNQGGGENPRGSITFTPDGKSLIELFKNRDKSTILHETGHFFLNVLRNAKSEPVRALWDKTRGWWSENHSEVYKEAKRYNPFQVKQHDLGYFGVNLGDREIHAFDSKKAADEFADQKHAEAVTELDARGGKDYVKKFIDGGMEAPDETDQMILTAMDEQFARGYEAYLLEGKAPDEGLRPVFRRFTAWLAKIYGSVTKLNVNLTPEIRDVFDRILASDEAIDATRHIEAFKPDPAIMEMMTKTQREAYLKQQQEREDSAREKTVRKALRDADKETKDWWKAEADAKEKALREVYLRQPDYAAAQHLREGRLEDGTPVKLDRAAVEEKYGKDVARAMDKKYFGTDGSDPDLIADSLGYNTGDDLVVALTKLDPLDRRVKDEVHGDMVKQHGDVFLNGDLEELAVRNMLSSEAAGLIEKEMKAVEDKTGPMPSGRDFKKAARDAVGAMSIRNATKPTRFLQAVIRMARAGAKALAGKDFEGYADAKRKELFALHMFRETRDFQDKFEKANDYFKQVARRPKLRTRATVDPEFRRMAWGVLANFMEARAPTLKLADLQTMIVKHITSEYDTPVYIPPEAETAWAKKSFKDMTVGEFNAVHDIVKGLMTYGHNKQAVMIDGQRKEFNEVMGNVKTIVGAVKNDRVDWSRNIFQKTVDKILAFELQTDTYLELLDKGDKTGFMQRTVKRPLDLGRAAETTESKKVYDDLREIFTSSWTPKELKEMTGMPGKFTKLRKMMVNGRAFTHEERLAYLLNSGNDGNAESVDTGMGWQDTERNAMMGTFSKKDFDFAQKVWDYVDSYWPRISALEEKRYGIAPDKIEARALQTPYGEYRGGYYPIKFDASLNKRVDDFDLEKEMKGYVGYASTATKRGYTKERVGPNSLDRMPVNLSFSTLTGHLQAVIHDLNMGEAIQQAAKILRDSRFKTPFVDRFGSDAYGAIDLWLKDIASGHIRDGNLFSQIDQWARRNAQVATMALNTTTIMSHPGRLMNSVEGLGGGAEGMKWIGVGFRKQFAAMRNPAEYRALLDAINKKSGMMKSRVDTMSREMADAQHHYSSDPMDTHKYRRALLLPIQLMQVHAVDISTWLGAYHQKLENSTEADPIAKEREAVFHADQIVRKYQGSGLMEDMSGLLRGTLSNNTRQSALVKTVTFAHSFFNNKFNRIYTATKLADFSTASGRYKYARAIITMSIMDALITDLLLQRLPGQTGEDDKKKVAEGWSWWMANRGLELFPLARETERMAKGQDTGTPAEEIAKAVAGAAAALHRDKEDKKELEAVISGVGMGTGLLPSVELNRFIDLMDRIREKQPVAYKDFVRSRRKSEK